MRWGIRNYYDIEIDTKYPLIRRKYFIHAYGAKDWEIYSYASLMWNLYTQKAKRIKQCFGLKCDNLEDLVGLLIECSRDMNTNPFRRSIEIFLVPLKLSL